MERQSSITRVTGDGNKTSGNESENYNDLEKELCRKGKRLKLVLKNNVKIKTDIDRIKYTKAPKTNNKQNINDAISKSEKKQISQNANVPKTRSNKKAIN
ncbi:hypothetical protein JTB14_002505 [Gonioctena quinquepunctata]|nr:hypothetical protein JTB14_002505 [Gonioctena quinquepunctata]